MTEVPREDFRQSIRNGKVAAVMYLPAEPPLEESFVQFRYSYRVRYNHIAATEFEDIDGEKHRVVRGTDPRLISLSERGQVTLVGAIATFYGANR